MRITDAPTQPPIRPLRRVAPLRYAERLTLPVGQKVSTANQSSDALTQGILAAVRGSEFTVVESNLGPDLGTRAVVDGGIAGGLIAERRVRRVATGTSMRVSIAVLVGAGVGLGALDMIIAGSVIYALPWVGVAAVGAFLLWLRYGRTYQSEVMEVLVAVAPTSPGRSSIQTGSGRTAEVVWRVGRIRSVAFAGIRAAVDIEDCPVTLMEALVGAVRRFQSQAN